MVESSPTENLTKSLEKTALFQGLQNCLEGPKNVKKSIFDVPRLRLFKKWRFWSFFGILGHFRLKMAIFNQNLLYFLQKYTRVLVFTCILSLIRSFLAIFSLIFMEFIKIWDIEHKA